MIVLFCQPPLERVSTPCRHGNQLKKVSIHWLEAKNSVAFVCGECVRKGKEEGDSAVGLLISMAVGADSLKREYAKDRDESQGCLQDDKDKGSWSEQHYP